MRVAGALICFIVCVASSLSAVIVLPSAPPKQAAIDWDGIDDMDGDGSAGFSCPGDTISATLRILCNSDRGYSLYIHSANATGTGESVLKNGSYEIPYQVTMDTSGVQNANIRKDTLRLNNANNVDFQADFRRNGNVLPLDGATQANELRFDMTLGTATGKLFAMGAYTDVITVTVSLN